METERTQCLRTEEGRTHGEVGDAGDIGDIGGGDTNARLLSITPVFSALASAGRRIRLITTAPITSTSPAARKITHENAPAPEAKSIVAMVSEPEAAYPTVSLVAAAAVVVGSASKLIVTPLVGAGVLGAAVTTAAVGACPLTEGAAVLVAGVVLPSSAAVVGAAVVVVAASVGAHVSPGRVGLWVC